MKGPEEQGGEPRVLLDGACCSAVSCAGFDGAEHLGQRAAANHLPDLLQILGQADLAPVSALDLNVAAEDFERRPDAGKDEVCATHAFALQPLHPVANAVRQSTQHIGPVSNRRIE